MAWWGAWRSRREYARLNKNLSSFAVEHGLMFTESKEDRIFTLEKVLDDVCHVKLVAEVLDDGSLEFMEVWSFDADGTDEYPVSVAQERGVFIESLSAALGAALGYPQMPQTQVGEGEVMQGILGPDEFVEPESWFEDIEQVRRRVKFLEDSVRFDS